MNTTALAKAIDTGETVSEETRRTMTPDPHAGMLLTVFGDTNEPGEDAVPSLMNHAASARLWPEHILILPVESPSMSPTLKPGDFMAVDTRQRAIHKGVYFVVGSFCDGSFWRATVRLQPTMNGKVLWIYDNKAISPEPQECSREATEEVIVGRVVFVESRL